MARFLILTLLLIPIQTSFEKLVSIDLKQPFKHRFIVQNLASLTIRVYQRNCEFTESCSNTLIFQAPMVIGKDEEETRSKLGFFKISKWGKFHQDYEGNYLAWNKNPPKPHSSRATWNKTGPFGWYTAFLEPNASEQWLHGTIGWGSDGENFIVHNKTQTGGFDRVRSKGCTRVSNQSIAFLRNFVPEGSLVLKIYALETLSDPSLAQYSTTKFSNSWTYSLSKKRIESDLFPLERFDLPYFEQNTLTYSQYPQVIEVKPKGEGLKNKKNYNPYELKRNDFKGAFLVDSGLLLNYSHPIQLLSNNNRIPKYFNHNFDTPTTLALGK